MEQHKWWKESVVYQIYPKSFNDSNGDGMGDIPGVIQKLDYLAWLGVDVLWISPFYPSPGYDNGYDISDYESIAPEFGTMQDFERLLQEAHARGMKVLIDLVVNHTSSSHPWFLQAVSAKDNEKRDFYIWRKGEGDKPPNNWGALFGGPAWTKTAPKGEYYLHLFSPQQPDLNWENATLREEVYAMMRRWLARGVDGFRMDVITLVAKPEDMKDGPEGPSGYHDPRAAIAQNPRLHEHLREMRRRAIGTRDVLCVGEAAAVTLEEACRLTGPDASELDMVFQFEHMDLDGGETFKWTDKTIALPDLKAVMDKWQLGLEGRGWNALFWNNHDQPRMLSRMGDEGEHREAAAKMLATCLHMMKGTPFIYQGEELGMTNMPFTSAAQLRDSESLNAYAKYTQSGQISPDEMLRLISMKSRDNGRTPMQWAAGPGAGFTTGTPWMDINPNHTCINAEEQLARPDSPLSYYKELIALRHAHEIVVYGQYQPLAQQGPHVFAYLRQYKGQSLLVCCNFAKTPQHFAPPEGFEEQNTRMLIGNMADSTYIKNSALSPFEAIVLLREEK